MATNYGKQYDELNWQNYINNINKVNTTAESQKQVINDNYGAQIKEAETAYDDQQRINAVQKLINERQVAESMANSGLTNSGLNRTQQTAVQLSYANNKAELDRQRQSAIDALNREMNSYLTDIETNRLSSLSSLESGYNESKTSYVSEREQADAANAATIEAATIKAEQEAAGKTGLYNYAYAETNDLGETEYRVFEIDGETKKVADGYNPYTRENNKIKYAYEAENYGFFSNGYQPKGVKGHGAFTGAVGTDNLYGKEQSVWQAADGTLWYWNGRNNEYELYDLNGDGKSNILDIIALKKRAVQ